MCKSLRGEEECKLVKQHPHFFDRLTRDVDALKQSLKPDWSKWKEEEEPPSPSDDVYDESSFVKRLTTAEIDVLTGKGAIVVADVHFPWCTQCGYTRKAFLSAAKELSSDNHIFGLVDARDDHEAATRC